MSTHISEMSAHRAGLPRWLIINRMISGLRFVLSALAVVFLALAPVRLHAIGIAVTGLAEEPLDLHDSLWGDPFSAPSLFLIFGILTLGERMLVRIGLLCEGVIVADTSLRSLTRTLY